jgi:hypothetical protein
MTSHHQPVVRSVVRRLRPSPTSFAAAAALYDPGPLLLHESTRRGRAVSPPTERCANRLDCAEACDVPVGLGCRNGTCHNCENSML